MLLEQEKAPRLIVVSGPSGAGKTTVVEAACAREPTLQRVPTATTRNRRPGEVDGESYLFMDDDEFSEAEREGLFLETARVHGRLYGTPKNAVETFLEHGLTPICILDPTGATTVRVSWPGELASVFIDADDQELRRRLEERVAADDIDQRMADAALFREHAAEYDIVLSNGQGRLPDVVHEFICVCQDQMGPFADKLDASFENLAFGVHLHVNDPQLQSSNEYDKQSI